MTLESAWSSLRSIILAAANFAVGKKVIRPGSKHWWSHPAIRPAYANLCAARHALLHRKRNRRTQFRFRQARSAWRAAVSLAKQTALDDLAHRLCSSPHHRLLYSYMRHIGSPRSDCLSSIPDSSGALPHDVAHSMNNLAQVFAQIFAAAPDDGHCAATTSAVRSCLNDPETIILHARDLIRFSRSPWLPLSALRVRATSATDPQDLAPAFIKQSPTSLHMALAALFNFSWVSGLVCDEWKVARGFPLFKGKGTDRPTRTRPAHLPHVYHCSKSLSVVSFDAFTPSLKTTVSLTHSSSVSVLIAPLTTHSSSSLTSSAQRATTVRFYPSPSSTSRKRLIPCGTKACSSSSFVQV